MNTTQPQHPARDRVLPAVVAGVLGALLVAALLLAGVVPALAGGRPMAVDAAAGDSSLAAGALVVVRPAAPVVGDVVALAPGPDGSRSLGVVESLDQTGRPVVTSADGRASALSAAQLDGVYLYGVPWVGAVWSALSTPSGMFFVAAVLLLLVAAHQLRAGRRRTRRRLPSGL